MARGLQVWSQTAASNNSADSGVNWAEGMAPSAVNDSARAEMASMAKWRDDNNGTIATTGTTAAYTVTSNQVSTANTDGYTLAVKFHATNDTSATLARDTAPAANLQLIAGTNVSGGEFLSGSIHKFKYDSGSTAWVAQGGNAIGASAISSNNIAAGAVAYSKIQAETAGTILGNGGSTAAPPAELTIGQGLVATSNSITAPAFPPTGAFKNLVIKVASTTTVAGSADYATLATSGSTSFITVPLTGTINMASTGVVNGIDTGALTGTTVYAIYGIAATSTSTSGGFLASTSFTTPLMPSGYAYKARLGAVVTTTTTGTPALYGSWQFGRRAQYVLGLAGTTVVPTLNSGSQGNPASGPSWSTTSTTKLVPSSASEIFMTIASGSGGGAITVAPSTAYGVNNSVTIAPPMFYSATAASGSISGSMLLESTNVYYASNDATAGLYCNGWVDNI